MKLIGCFVFICVLSKEIAQTDILLSRLGLNSEDTFSDSQLGLKPMVASSLQQGQQLDTLYVTSDGFENNGIFFAFKAFWFNLNSINVQIWRLQQSGTPQDPVQNFYFVASVDIIPEQANTTHTVYIVSSLDQKCIRVKQGDRIGFQVKNGSKSPFSISYDESLEKSAIFVTTGESANLGNSTNHNPLNFSRRIFPYKMNFIAYIVVDNTQTAEIRAECPKNLMVDSITTTTPAFIQGDTGPVGDTGSIGDTGSVGPIGATGLTGPYGPQGQKGSVGFKGAVGGTGPNGPIGAQGPQGSIGNTGTVGDVGYIGPQGDTGPQGPDGIPGYLILFNSTDDEIPNNPSRFAALVDEVATSLTDNSKWKSEPFLIGLLIWLCILSLLTLIFVIVLISLCYKFHYKKRQRSRKSTIMAPDGWDTLATSAASELNFSKDTTVSTLDINRHATIGKEDGENTLRMYASSENLRALKEETFKELTNDTIAMY